MTYYVILSIIKHLETGSNHRYTRILNKLCWLWNFDILATRNSNKQDTNFILYYHYLGLNKHKATEKASNEQSYSTKTDMRFLITYNMLSCSNHEPRTILKNLHRFTNPRPSKINPAPLLITNSLSVWLLLTFLVFLSFYY